jgi:hypothetical protein
MPLALALLSAIALRAAGNCTPASADELLAAERRAADADRKAEQAESIAVRSGNPGAQARAKEARAQAAAAQQEADALACKPGAKMPSRPLGGAATGY